MGLTVRIHPDPLALGNPGGGGPTSDTGGLIRLTSNQDGSGSVALHGGTATGTCYVYLSSAASGAVSVVWSLDGITGRSDSSVPFDFEADTAGERTALRAMSNGSHTIAATYTDALGTTETVEADFTAGGVTGPPPTGGGVPATVVARIRAATGTYGSGNVTGFGTQLGRTINHRLYYLEWRNLAMSALVSGLTGVLSATWKASSWTMHLKTPMLTDPNRAVNAAKIRQGRDGAFDATWDAFGDVLDGLTLEQIRRLVIHLGWEFNGDWYPWGTNSGTSAEQLALAADLGAYWARIVTRVRARLSVDKWSALLWEWCPVGGGLITTTGMSAQGVARAEASWPGDSVVDIVGGDFYTNHDYYTETSMRDVLAWITDMAIRHGGKKTAMSETNSGAYLNMASGDSWKSTWDSTPLVPYTVGHIVENDGLIYRCIAAAGANEPPNSTYWERAYQHRGDYSGSTTYTKSDIVRYNGTERTLNVASALGSVPSGTAWKNTIEGRGDLPGLATVLWTWSVQEATALRLHNVVFFETDPASERGYYASVARRRTIPGREAWTCGTIPVTSTNGSPLVNAVWPLLFVQGDIGRTVTATGIPAATTVASVNTDGTIATLSANATATGARTLTFSGIPVTGMGCNFPRLAREVLRYFGGA